jgi:UDP-N-acetylmuramoyl-tripeptide--D-alanyl-D-alanine ligase
MFDLNLQQLHEILGGRLRLATLAPRDGDATRIGRIVTDSRQLAPGDVFWGLAGPKFDGSDFAEQAFEAGATGVVVAGRYVKPWPGRWSLEVDNGERSLTRLATWNRDAFGGRVVAVTGSVGKTTARQMIYAVLSTRSSGVASRKNFNNQIGVPLSMLALRQDHEFAVFELGASAPGEIGQLATLCRAEIGVITCLGEAHLGGFGDSAAIVAAKCELLSTLPEGGWAILPGDDPILRRTKLPTSAKVLWLGRSLECDLVATQVESRDGRISFCVDGDPYEVPVWGRHHLMSALAAVAVGRIFDLSSHEIARGLAEFQPPPMRCEVISTGDVTLINDSYNASPTAMRAALELLRDFDAPGRRIVVCGEMRELGKEAARLHRKLGDEVVTLCGADLLIACGGHAEQVLAGARAAGMPASRALSCEGASKVASLLDGVAESGDVVLLKGSRALALEQVVADFERRRSNASRESIPYLAAAELHDAASHEITRSHL